MRIDPTMTGPIGVDQDAKGPLAAGGCGAAV